MTKMLGGRNAMSMSSNVLLQVVRTTCASIKIDASSGPIQIFKCELLSRSSKQLRSDAQKGGLTEERGRGGEINGLSLGSIDTASPWVQRAAIAIPFCNAFKQAGGYPCTNCITPAGDVMKSWHGTGCGVTWMLILQTSELQELTVEQQLPVNKQDLQVISSPVDLWQAGCIPVLL